MRVRVSILALSVLLAPGAASGDDLDGVVFAASAGVPKLESNALNVEGAARLGYVAPTFGGWAHGELATFDVSQANREQTEVKRAAESEGWYRLSLPGVHVALLFGASAGFAQYSNDATFFVPFSSIDEVSQMVRGSAAVGALWRLPEALAARGELSGGVQREAYLRTGVDGGGALDEVAHDASTFRYDVKLTARWSVVPSTLSLDGLLELEGFRISRSEALFVYDPSLGIAQQASVADGRRVEVTGRVELALVLAEVVGVVPFAYAQLRHMRTSAAAATVAVSVPSGGIGLRTKSF